MTRRKDTSRSRRGVDENDGGDVGMIVTASLPRSFADIPYQGKILWNGSSQPIT